MKLIYIASGDVSVYESQVLELLSYLQNSIEIVLLQGFKNKKEKKKIADKLSNYPLLKVLWVQTYPVYPLFENKNVNSIYKGMVSIKEWEKAIIHVRSEYLGFILKKIIQKYRIPSPLLIDIRGLLYEEMIYKSKECKGYRKCLYQIQATYLNKCYNFLFRKDNFNIFITSVSSVINEYIRERYSGCAYPLVVHPNIAGSRFIYSDRDRQRIRKEYGFSSNQLVAVCSTGGNAVWQQDHLIISKLIDVGIKVINLSKNDPQIDGCITVFIPFSEVPKMLSAVDIAVLWRNDTFINNSASPSKFSEFATMGLFVIHNGTVNIATDYISKSGGGCIVDKISDLNNETFDSISCNNRVLWIDKGKEEFGIENIGKSYKNTYNAMRTNVKKHHEDIN